MALVSINWNPPTHQVRQFGLVALAFCSLVAGWWWYQHGYSAWVGVAAGLGLAAALCGFVWPAGLRCVQVALMVAVYPIGLVMSFVVLVVIWYGVFTLVAFFFRLIGRDALQRSFEPDAPTYWQHKTLPTDPRRYLRQY